MQHVKSGQGKNNETCRLLLAMQWARSVMITIRSSDQMPTSERDCECFFFLLGKRAAAGAKASLSTLISRCGISRSKQASKQAISQSYKWVCGRMIQPPCVRLGSLRRYHLLTESSDPHLATISSQGEAIGRVRASTIGYIVYNHAYN